MSFPVNFNPRWLTFQKFKYANLLSFAFSYVIINKTLFKTILSKIKLTNNLPAEMAHPFLTFYYSVCWVNSIAVGNWLNSSIFLFKSTNNKTKYHLLNILGGFLLQLQVQMKTRLEVMNMHSTYEVRSRHIVDFQRNAIPLQ